MARERITITLQKSVLKKIDDMIDGHAIRNRSHAIDSILMGYINNSPLKYAIILGGGEKEKKISAEEKKPRLLFEVYDKTVVEYNIEMLKSYGITNIIFALGFANDEVRNKIGDGSKYGVRTMYFERDNGTANILRQIKDTVKDTFLMMNGDILLQGIDINDMYNFHKSFGGQATMLLATANDFTKFGSISMRGNIITDFVEKPNKDNPTSHLINGGVYIFESSVCSMVTPETFSLEHDIFPRLAKSRRLFGYLLDGTWIHLHDEKHYADFLKSKEYKK